MNEREFIKDIRGIIIGWVETDLAGNKIVKNFKGIIIGYYNKGLNVTKDYRGIIIGRGDSCVSLLYNKQNNSIINN